METWLWRALGPGKIQVHRLNMTGKLLTRSILIIWIAVWAIFLVRPYFKKGLFNDYRALLGLSLEGKRGYVTGEGLYDFIKFCNDAISAPATYNIIGLEEDPLGSRRAIYYLYPKIETPEPRFLFVYGVKNFSKESYSLFKSLSPDKYILKRRD